MRGDLRPRSNHYETSLRTYDAPGCVDQFLGPVLNNMGLVYTQLDRARRGADAYDEALNHCDAPATRASAHGVVNSTDMWLARGDIDARRALCDTVLLRGDGGRATNARWARRTSTSASSRGCAAIWTRRSAGSARRYDNAMRREDLLLAAETSREQAELYESIGRNRETLQALSLVAPALHEAARAERNLADLAAPHRADWRRASTTSSRAGPARSNPRTRTRSAIASASPTTRARSPATSASTRSRCSGSASARCCTTSARSRCLQRS